MRTPRDENGSPVKMGILCTDGVTLVPIAIDQYGRVKTDAISTISFTPGDRALRDENAIPTLLAQRSDNGTPIPIYVNADGAILISA